ncbi:MAG: NADH-quinone oxidoreductase subunit A [Candidatus Glassbacteria bacterium]
MLFQYANVLVFLSLGVVFLAVTLLIGSLIRPRVRSPQKYTTYECGENPIGSSWIQFNIRFYIIALIFVIFDVEVAFLFPWAVIFRDIGLVGFVEMLIFVAILLLGLAYVWKNGDLDWIKPRKS